MRRDIPPGAKALKAALGGRSTYLVPVVRGDMIREFYRWCQSYAGMAPDGSRARAFAHECAVCANSRYVLKARSRELVRCPRYEPGAKRCWQSPTEARLPYMDE